MNFPLKAKLSGAFLCAIFLISPAVASADVFDDMSANLSEAATSLSKIMESLSFLSGTQQAQVSGTSGTLSPTITLLSPKGGETFSTQDSILVQYSVANLPTGTLLTVYLYSPTLGNVTSNLISGPSSGTGTGSLYLALPNVSGITTGQYKINICALSVDNPSIPGKPLCRLSDNYFTISATASAAPTITSITPASGPAGTRITLSGTGFSLSNTVNFIPVGIGPVGQTNASYGVISSEIIFDIPSNLTTAGVYNVQVGNERGSSNNILFTVTSQTSASPTITSISPMSASVGSKVYVYGSNFSQSSYIAADCCKPLVIPATFVNNGTLSFVLPAGMSIGTHIIQVGSGTSNDTLSNSVSLNVVSPPTPTLTITVTAPNGGETLFAGSTKNITWTSSSVIDKVSIGYSTGPGSLNWIANNIPNTNSYNWTVNVGNTTNTQFKIYIIGYQTGTGSVTDESDNFFSVHSIINKTDLEIFKLCFGKYVSAGDSCFKSDFDASGFINFADMAALKSASLSDLNSDNIADLRDTPDNADLNFMKSCLGLYTTSSTSCVKADLVVNGVVNAIDLAKFKSAINYDLNGDSRVDLRESVAPVPTPTITVLSPNGGETWAIGSTQIITWNTSNFPAGSTVYVELRPYDYNVSPVRKIASVSSVYGSYTWQVPSDIIPGQYRIEIYKANQSGNIDPSELVKDISNTPFSIIVGTNIPTLTVLSPNGGEMWEIGKTYSIRWKGGTPTSLVQVGLRDSRYNPNLGSGENVIVNTTNTGTYEFKVPLSLEGLSNGFLGGDRVYRVVVYEKNSGLSDESDAPFSIFSTDTIAPSSPTSLVANAVPGTSKTTVTLTWVASTDNMGVVGYKIYRNGVLIATTSATTVYIDAIGLLPGTNYSYTISAIDAAGNISPPSSAVTIATSGTPPPPTNSMVTILSPNGGEVWVIGKSHQISWTPNRDDVNLVLLDVNKNYIATIEGIRGSSSPYSWTIPPSVAPGKYYIRGEGEALGFSDDSDAPFTISSDATIDSLKAQLRSLLARVDVLRAQLALCKTGVNASLTADEDSIIKHTQSITGDALVVGIDELQKYINLLLNIINRLNAQISTCQNTTTTPPVITPPVTQPPVIQPPVLTERNLYRGMRGESVRKLQELLSRDPQIYPSGQVTGYFGYLTEAAVQNFQCKYGIVCDGDLETTGYGVVGPKTMVKINEVASSMSGGSTGNSGTVTSPSQSGNTVADLQAQINAFLEQLKMLQAQLNALPR